MWPPSSLRIAWPVCGVPNLGRVVPAAGGDQPAVGRNGGGSDGAVRAVAHDRACAIEIPQLRIVAADREHVAAIGANIADQTSPPSWLKSRKGRR